MSSCRWIQRLQRLSGRKRDLFIIISGIVLGASTQFLFTHVWHIANDLLSIFGNWVFRHPDLLEVSKTELCRYVRSSAVGIIIEVIAIIVVIIVLILFFHRDRDDEIVAGINGLRQDINSMKSELVAAINRLGNRIGGGNATKENEINKGQTGKTKKESEESGETQDNQRPVS